MPLANKFFRRPRNRYIYIYIYSCASTLAFMLKRKTHLANTARTLHNVSYFRVGKLLLSVLCTKNIRATQSSAQAKR